MPAFGTFPVKSNYDRIKESKRDLLEEEWSSTWFSHVTNEPNLFHALCLVTET